MPIQDIDFDYKLNNLSVVFDVGSYNGDFANMIHNKYTCGVHIFEPVKENFKRIVKRFERQPLLWPYDVALYDIDQDDAAIYLKNNSSTLFGSTEEKELIRLRDVYKFIQGFKLDHIDLLKMNCEGAEYAIMNRLYANHWIQNVKQIIVQFHGIAGNNREELEQKLSETHEVKHKCDHWQWHVIK